MQNNVKRWNPSTFKGLTTEEVATRKKQGLVHHDTDIPTKSIKQIVRDNFFTLFNFLNIGLALAVLLVGSYKNLLFLGIVFCNMFISIIQEVRAKRTIDKLSIIEENEALVVRDGKKVTVKAHEIVLDDIICYQLGNQILVDSIIMSGDCIVNESIVTGEENPVSKKQGDILLSGSFVVRGSVICKVEHIGEENYSSKISKDAKYLKKLNSELMISLEKIVKFLSLIIIPIGILLFWGQMRIPNNTLESAVIHTVAGLIGMIPDGLVLLTSSVLAVSVIRLSKYDVLVQELYCIEMLARVDVLCLDKTGTITEGKMELKEVVPISMTKKEISKILGEMTYYLEDNTPTMEAIRTLYHGKGEFTVLEKEEFSSDSKYSKVTFEKEGSFLLGAPEFIMKNKKQQFHYQEKLNEYRVLLLAKSDGNKIEEVAYLYIQDKIRDNAKKTISYFKEQGVSIKIISGDNPVTVSQIAKRVGIEDYQSYIDLSTIDSEEELKNAVSRYTIFGRVTPLQKKQLICNLKEMGHTVAMTGDGVNDVLALKEADCSVAMASGHQAVKSVSQLVLLNSNFDSMPRILGEGRRTINNITRSASLFLVKTIYVSLLSVLFLFLNQSYPFEPIQMSLTNMVTIGIPSFILALEPNHDLVRGKFLLNVLSVAFPTAFTIFTLVVGASLFGPMLQLSSMEISTLCVYVVAGCGFMHLFRVSLPFTPLRKALLFSMLTVFLLEVIFLPDLFSLVPLNLKSGLLLVIGLISSVILYMIYKHLFELGKSIYQKQKKG